MKSKFPDWLIVVIFVLSALGILAILSRVHAHAQEITPQVETTQPAPAFFVVDTDEKGVKSWQAIIPVQDLKLYCYNGSKYVPCQVEYSSKERSIVALGPIMVEPDPQDKPASTPMNRAAR